LLKHADELRVGDTFVERSRTYRVTAITPGLTRSTLMVTAACATTGQRRTLNFFRVNRVEVRDEPT